MHREWERLLIPIDLPTMGVVNNDTDIALCV